MNNRLKKYSEYINLGDDLYECEKSTVKHQTTITQRNPNGEITIIKVKEVIEFS